MRPLICQPPFQAKISFCPCLRVRRNNRHEQRAFLDLFANLCVPRIAAPELALIEPDFDSGGAERVSDASRGVRVLRRIGKESGSVLTGAHGFDSGFSGECLAATSA